MTATHSDHGTIPVQEVPHPIWCTDTGGCHRDLPVTGYVEHDGPLTTWEGGDIRYRLRLRRTDCNFGRQDRGSTSVYLQMEDTGSINPDGSPIQLETHLDEADLDVLIHFLTAHRRRLHHDRGSADISGEKFENSLRQAVQVQ